MSAPDAATDTVMATMAAVPASQRDTWKVSHLIARLDASVREAAGGQVWVEAEWSNRRKTGYGIAVELVERSSDGTTPTAVLSAFISNDHIGRLQKKMRDGGVTLKDGSAVRVGGNVNLRQRRGELNLRINDIDVDWIRARDVIARDQLIAALKAAGTLDINKHKSFPVAVDRVTVITSVGSAAYHDFVDELHQCAYSIELNTIDVRVQGDDAARQVAAALTSITTESCELVVIIRGGGSKADLAAFDEREVVEAVANCPVAVIAGIGHEIDESICDLAAHTTAKTPTAAARVIIDVNDKFLTAVDNASNTITRRCTNVMHAAGDRLNRLDSTTGRLATSLLGRHTQRLNDLGRRTTDTSQRTFVRCSGMLDQHEQRAGRAAVGRVRSAGEHLNGLERAVNALHPQRTLERGFSIVRTAAGELITSTASVNAGDTISITVSDGSFDATAAPDNH